MKSCCRVSHNNTIKGRLNIILTYGEPSSVSVFTTTGGVFPWRQRERGHIMKKQWQKHKDEAAPGSALSTSLKPTITAKTDGHFSS